MGRPISKIKVDEAKLRALLTLLTEHNANLRRLHTRSAGIASTLRELLATPQTVNNAAGNSVHVRPTELKAQLALAQAHEELRVRMQTQGASLEAALSGFLAGTLQAGESKSECVDNCAITIKPTKALWPGAYRGTGAILLQLISDDVVYPKGPVSIEGVQMNRADDEWRFASSGLEKISGFLAPYVSALKSLTSLHDFECLGEPDIKHTVLIHMPGLDLFRRPDVLDLRVKAKMAVFAKKHDLEKAKELEIDGLRLTKYMNWRSAVWAFPKKSDQMEIFMRLFDAKRK